MKRWTFAIAILVGSILLLGSRAPKQVAVNQDSPVWEILEALGAPLPEHVPNQKIQGMSAEVGKAIVFEGIADKPNGGDTRKQSKHFVCTSCHNTKKEDPDLSRVDPQARLEYVAQEGMPFLQGTSLYGAVNRMSFYNGDYEKKYGELVIPARNNLREAIQLCAVECSQGRRLKDWELESVLAYLWTIQLKLDDLNLDNKMYSAIAEAIDNQPAKRAALVKQIKERYRLASPAHFVKPPDDRKAGYPYKGQPANGKLIYELSCLHCHAQKKYSFFELDNSKLSFKYLSKHFPKYSHASVYQVARYGAPSLYGKRAYMPQYPQEKMSDQQLEDLRAYIDQRAKE